MKELAPHQIKKPTKLFNNKYRAKIVFRSVAARAFRPETAKRLLNLSNSDFEDYLPRRVPDSAAEIKLAKELLTTIDYNNCSVRVEYPLVTVYTNDLSTLEDLVNVIGKANVKYVSLFTDEVIAPDQVFSTLPYDFKLHIGKVNTSIESFVNWAENNKNVRITKSALSRLRTGKGYSTTHLYVKGEKTLTMVKMFLGNAIIKIENIIKK